MLCISLSSSNPGALVGALAGPDGCPIDAYIALTPAEFNTYMVSPFKLGSDEAGAISVAVLGIWAIGFGIRMAIRAIRDTGPVGGNPDE